MHAEGTAAQCSTSRCGNPSSFVTGKARGGRFMQRSRSLRAAGCGVGDVARERGDRVLKFEFFLASQRALSFDSFRGD